MKTVRTLIGITITLAVGAILFKKIKKGVIKLEKEEKERKASLDKAGVPAEKLNEEVDPDDKDPFIKTVYANIEFCDPLKFNWDRDVIRIESEDGKKNGFFNSDRVIHVLQSDTNDGKYLNFLFEIQETAFSNKKETHNCGKYPKVRDYITTIKPIAKLVSNKLNKIYSEQYPKSNIKINFEDLVRSSLVGYYVVSFRIRGVCKHDGEEDIEIQKFVQIPKENYKDLDDRDSNVALTKYFQGVYNGSINYKDSIVSPNDIINSGELMGDEIYDIKIITCEMMYRLSIPMYIEGLQLGIDVNETLSLIKYFLDKLIIKRENDRKSEEIMYDQLIFNTYDPRFPLNKDGDLLYYYTVTTEDTTSPDFRSRKIIINDYSYGEE